MSDTSKSGAGRPSGIGFSWKILPMAAITALVIYLLVEHLAGAEDLLEVVQQVDLIWVGLAVGFAVANFVLVALHWRLILSAMGFDVPSGRVIRVILATRPFDFIAPSRANDLLRPLGVRDIVPVLEGSGSVVAQRVIDVQSLCLLALGGALWAQLWSWAAVLAGGLVAGWLALAALFWKRDLIVGLPLVGRFEDKLAQLFEAFVALVKNPAKLALAAAVSLLAWTMALAIVWALGRAFGAELSIVEIGALWPLAVFVGMLPLTVAGMGTRDAAFLSLLELTRAAPIEQAPILATSFGYAVVGTWLAALIGIPFMLRYMYKLPDTLPEDEEHNHVDHR